MRPHNVMENVVVSMVDGIVGEEFLAGDKGFCVTEQCKQDVICYVLNKIQPRYIVSGRGLTHFHMDYLEKLQREADLAARIYKAIDVVTGNLRPTDSEPADQPPAEGSCFNLPAVTGRIFNSLNFEPASDVDVHLYREGRSVRMIDTKWQNPVHLVSNAGGSFSFWGAPIPAPASDSEEIVEFEVSIDSPRFEPLQHYFQLTLRAQPRAADHFTVGEHVQVGDLYLSPR